MTATTDERTALKIGDKQYYEDTLPEKVKQLIQIYSKWNSDVVDARLEVSKHEAAIRDIYREILDGIASVEPVPVAPTSETEADASAE